MAAPSGTVWGSIAYGKGEASRGGRIGIYRSETKNNTTISGTIEIWFWSKYGVSDTGNTLYYDNLSSSGSATTNRGASNIQTSVSTGAGWSTSNQKLLKSFTYSNTRGTSDVKRYLYAKLTDVDRVAASMYVSTTFTVPKLDSYTVSYNANGGTGAPSSQTKWYGNDLTLSSTKPTRTGYSFQGWATSTGGSVAYAAGASYTSNSNITLYAVWRANAYTVSYNANGGTGAPGSQTKTYGETLKLSSTRPTRTNYNFLGWATSATATTATYAAGGNYTGNSNIALYAVWELAYVKPRIADYEVCRVDKDGKPTDNGTNVQVKASFKCDRYVLSYKITWQASGEAAINTKTVMYSNEHTEGQINEVIDGGVFSADKTYTITLTVTDQSGYSAEVLTLPGAVFAIDMMSGGRGIALNKPAELEGVMDIGFQTRLLGGLMYVLLPAETDLNECHTPGFYIGENVSTYNYVNCPLTSGTFTLEILSMGDNGQLMQRLTQCHITSPIVFERTYYVSAGWGEWFGGWVYPTIGSEFTVYASDGVSSKPGCRKDGRTVEVRGIVKPVIDIAGGTDMHTIITVPVGYRPNSPVYVICQGSGNCTWLLRVNTSGTVDFSRYRNGDTSITASAGAWLPFQVTYLV